MKCEIYYIKCSNKSFYGFILSFAALKIKNFFVAGNKNKSKSSANVLIVICRSEIFLKYKEILLFHEQGNVNDEIKKMMKI